MIAFRFFISQLATSAQAWCLHHIVPVTGLGLALLVVGWGTGFIVLPNLAAQLEQEIEEQIDYEDGVLCQKFRFAPGTQDYIGCKLDLADLRRRHEQLRSAYEFP